MNSNFYRRTGYLRYYLAGILIIFGLFGKGADSPSDPNQNGLCISTFDIDVTPPIGSFLAYGSATSVWDLGLRARGIVIMGAGKPIVLCSVDWIGIGNEGHDAFCFELAQAAGTTTERVAVHTVHQHDTPWCDFGAEKILRDAGFDPTKYDGDFTRGVIKRLGIAVRNSLANSTPVTYVGYGEAKVFQVASNRRIIGKDGRIMEPRLSACTDSVLRAQPEGLIDPLVSLISFWNADKPVAVLSYYAVHPQSYYRTGVPNPDFPGVARFMRQLAVPQALHIHFNGAGGNVAAGKYNDGSMENRGILAQRLTDGMKRAWEATKRFPITTNQVQWAVEPLSLPPAKYLNKLQDKNLPPDSLLVRCYAARLAWLRRCQEGKKINLGCLYLGKIRILHLPGEPFIEYQLAAKAERKDLFVAVAGYGDYGPGYIGTSIAYQQGGYETSHVSNVAPETENVLMSGIRKLLRLDFK
jgi:hypothetical protein